MSAAFVLPLDSAEATLSLAGGKGMNLARMARAGLPVPGGFLITTEAYKAFLVANSLAPWLAEQLRPASEEGAASLDDPASLAALSERIRGRFAAGKVPAPLAEAIRQPYAALGRPPVAVRSSATAEDLPDLSFAGQQDTFLQVLGDEALLAAVVGCWSSLWTARAIGYRARNAIPQEEVALAVVVQQMVPSQVSGVLFTANPLNGRRTEMAIDATFGLGEALVSGQVEPDHIVVDAGSGRVLQKQLGSKAVAIHGQPGGGTVTISGDGAGQQALPDEALAGLVEMGRRVAALFQSPQDIEWAWAGGQFHLLQARPITSLYPLPAGADQPEPLEVLLSFGAVQGVVGPMTPLGLETIQGFLAGGAAVFGYRVTAQTQRAILEAGQRLFLNFTPVVRHRLGRRVMMAGLSFIEPGARQAMAGLLSDPRLQPEGRSLSLSTMRRLLPFFFRVVRRSLAALWRPERARQRLEALTRSLLEETAAAEALAGNLQERLALHSRVVGATFPLVLGEFLPVIAAGMVSLNVLRQLEQWLPDGGAQALAITRGVPHNVTTEMDLALWQTARAIASDPAAAAYLAGQEAGELAQAFLRREMPAAAASPLAAFLERYGMRGIGEIDLGQPRWREDPTPVLQSLQSYLRITDPERAPDAVFRRGQKTAQETTARLLERVRRQRAGSIKAWLIRAAAGRVRQLIGLRESPKFLIVRLMGIVRQSLWRSGEELVEAGLLARPEEIFFLRLAELQAVAAGEPGDWASRAAARRLAGEREQRRRQVPRLLLSDGQAFYEGIGAADAGSADGLILGSPVSPGVVEGPVRVVLDPFHAQLEPGDILVCPGTDPAWTPLFLAAGGLVMEVGGLMTHGSVVAREYGIPAVVGVHQATTRLRSGQRVRLDGGTGRVVLLPPTVAQTGLPPGA